MPTAIPTTRPSGGLKAVAVPSRSRPGLVHTVTFNRQTRRATSCTCEAGSFCRSCRHKREVEAAARVMRHVKAEYPTGVIGGHQGDTCPRCQGPAMVVSVNVMDGPTSRGYTYPHVCPECGVVRHGRP